MPIFVDHAGMNTVIGQDLDLDTNTMSLDGRERTQAPQNLTRGINIADGGKYLSGSVNGSGYPSSGLISFSFWAKLNDSNISSISEPVFFTYSGSSPSYYSLQAYFKSSRFNFSIRDDNNSLTQIYGWNVDGEVLASQWNHFALSFAGNYQTSPTLYFNGEVATDPAYIYNPTLTVAASWRDIQNLYLGANPLSVSTRGCSLAQLAFWEDVLSESDISTLYNSGSLATTIPNGPNILDYWSLGEESEISSLTYGDDITGSTLIPSTLGSQNTNLTASSGAGDAPTLVEGPGYVASGIYSLEGYVAIASDEAQLAAINTHRNGPYGFSSWKQIRTSQNPISRKYRSDNQLSFVLQPGPLRNVLSSGELFVRDRYSQLYKFKEPAVCQKTYPLVFSVGRHTMDSQGNVDVDSPFRFGMATSYENEHIGFANKEVDVLLKYAPENWGSDYKIAKSYYLAGALNRASSPLTYWEFMKWRETIFPKPEQQYVSQTRTRPTFESFYRHSRANRDELISSTNSFFGFTDQANYIAKMSTWPLDATTNFLTENISEPDNIDPTSISGSLKRGAGILQSRATQYIRNLNDYTAGLTSSVQSDMLVWAEQLDSIAAPFPMYSRRTQLAGLAALFNNGHPHSNPSGLPIRQTSSSDRYFFEGSALWEAGTKRHITNSAGEYVSAPKYPFYDTYENYVDEVKRYGKNYSIIPEFRMSTQVEDYLSNELATEIDMFDVVGGISGIENSSKDSFYEIYSTSDFLKSFQIIQKDHETFAPNKVLKLRCKAIKKFLPYEGFYPCQRAVDVAQRFYDSFQNNIKVRNELGVEIDGFNYGKQMVLTPLFAPGVLFNTIKSGVAVDYPIYTGSLSVIEVDETYVISDANGNSNFSKRIPFEALVEPKKYLANYKLTSNEPHPSGNLSASALWDGQGDGLYSKIANNFLAEIPEFFLPDGNLTSVVSKRQEDIKSLDSGVVYGMRVKMRRSMDKTRPSVYHSGSEQFPYIPPQDIILTGSSACRETFTMYSTPMAFGPPTRGVSAYAFGSETFRFDQDRFGTNKGVNITHAEYKGYENGYNFPFTPPYYHGEAWCDIWITGSGEPLSIEQIQAAVTSSFTRFDHSFYSTSSTMVLQFGAGPQSFYENRLNRNAVQLSSSLNIFGIGTTREDSSELVVDTGVAEKNRWVIQTKFETPMLNFNHVSGSDHLTLPASGAATVPRGMWHQHGRIPEENEGVFISVEPIPENYQKIVMGRTSIMEDLSDHLGFSGNETKIGRLASSKKISEAVVAVPFVTVQGRKRFFKIPQGQVDTYKESGVDGFQSEIVRQNENIRTGQTSTVISYRRAGNSRISQMQKMEKYIFPPSFDFLNNENVDPIAMYIFEFSHTLSQQDLSDIWQNLPPDIGQEMQVAEAEISHPLLKQELLSAEDGNRDKDVTLTEDLRWMVFKVKQRAASNYFKKTVTRNPNINQTAQTSDVDQDEFGSTNNIQYNWPYDFFSLVEMVKLDAEVEVGNMDRTDRLTYTNNIPPWTPKVADGAAIKAQLTPTQFQEQFLETLEEEGASTAVSNPSIQVATIEQIVGENEIPDTAAEVVDKVIEFESDGSIDLLLEIYGPTLSRQIFNQLPVGLKYWLTWRCYLLDANALLFEEDPSSGWLIQRNDVAPSNIYYNVKNWLSVAFDVQTDTRYSGKAFAAKFKCLPLDIRERYYEIVENRFYRPQSTEEFWTELTELYYTIYDEYGAKL